MSRALCGRGRSRPKSGQRHFSDTSTRRSGSGFPLAASCITSMGRSCCRQARRTIRESRPFGIHLGNVKDFVVDGLMLDHTHRDGVHGSGPASDSLIHGVRFGAGQGSGRKIEREGVFLSLADLNGQRARGRRSVAFWDRLLTGRSGDGTGISCRTLGRRRLGMDDGYIAARNRGEGRPTAGIEHAAGIDAGAALGGPQRHFPNRQRLPVRRHGDVHGIPRLVGMWGFGAAATRREHEAHGGTAPTKTNAAPPHPLRSTQHADHQSTPATIPSSLQQSR